MDKQADVRKPGRLASKPSDATDRKWRELIGKNWTDT